MAARLTPEESTINEAIHYVCRQFEPKMHEIMLSWVRDGKSIGDLTFAVRVNSARGGLTFCSRAEFADGMKDGPHDAVWAAHDVLDCPDDEVPCVIWFEDFNATHVVRIRSILPKDAPS